MHLVPFRCLTKLGAKRREVVQKFGPWSRVRIFHNKPFDPPHWTLTLCFGALRTIWVHLGEFGCVTTLSAIWANLVQKFMPRSRVGIFHNELTQSSPLDPKLMFFCISYYLIRSRVRIFRNKGTLSTPLDPKLMFWCVSYYVGAFGTVCLRYEPWCKTGRTCAKVRAMKSRHNFSQQTHLKHPIRP